MKANDLVRRINDNLHWSHVNAKEALARQDRPQQIWEQIEALLAKPDEEFVSGLYPLLLERLADDVGMASHCRFMAAGTPRAEIVRVIALSEEARERDLDVSWLPLLDGPPPSASLRRFSVASLKDAFWRLTPFRFRKSA